MPRSRSTLPPVLPAEATAMSAALASSVGSSTASTPTSSGLSSPTGIDESSVIEEEWAGSDLQVQLEQLAQESRRSSVLTSVWEEKVLPHWKDEKSSELTRQLIWEGVPSAMRKKVWKLRIGNKLGLRPKDYQKLSKVSKLDHPKLASKFSMIDRDVPRARISMADVDIFHESAQESMKNILRAYVISRPEMGYAQAMSYLCAFLYIYYAEKPAEVFIAFSNILELDLCSAFITDDYRRMEAYYIVFDFFLERNAGDLAKYLKMMDLPRELYLMPWFVTLFTNILPQRTAARVWDNFFLDGHSFLFRTAIALLICVEKDIMKKSFEDIAALLSAFPVIPEKTLFDTIAKVEIPEDKLEKHFEKVLCLHRPSALEPFHQWSWVDMSCSCGVGLFNSHKLLRTMKP